MATFYGDNFVDDIDGTIFADRIYGYGGGDIISGGSGNDYLSGGADYDDLYGGSGHDDMYGGSGRDYLSASSGDDLLVGGTSSDTLIGGTGEDVFSFRKGESGLTTSTVDTIRDWNRLDDSIDMTVRGTASNYREHSTTATSIASARIWAEDLYPSVSIKHVYLYNARTDTGYLVSDLNSDGAFDTGVVLRNAGLASDMHYSYII
jgi:Ca2+-binding RTX toxin-like protein